MDKPISLSVKDFIIRKMAVKMMVSEALIEEVVNHQFKSAQEAMKTPDIESVEISGFGKFLFNKKKALNKLEIFKLNIERNINILSKPDITPAQKRRAETMVSNTMEEINALKSKLYNYERQGNIRGVEEQAGSPSVSEGTDKTYSQEEDGDLREMHLSLGGEEEEIQLQNSPT